MVITVGPVSKPKPSCSSRPQRPPTIGSRSTTVTSCPAASRWQALARPASPAPITTTRFIGGSPVAPGDLDCHPAQPGDPGRVEHPVVQRPAGGADVPVDQV